MPTQLFISCFAIVLLLNASSYASEQAKETEIPLVVNIKRMSMETALKIARASIEACRAKGIQVGVTVVDRGGHPQVILRDVLAPDLTLQVSRQKAYTAMSFNRATSEMLLGGANIISQVEGVLMAAGGVPIEFGGTLYGGIGVSGAPNGKTDEECAQAGLKAVAEDMELLE
ncbi:MAG: heme-binding protein [Pseudomonadota bacterium]